MHPCAIDLHCHSTVSDGVLSPEALAERAYQQGVKLWALTDHDEIAGVAPAAALARYKRLAGPEHPGYSS